MVSHDDLSDVVIALEMIGFLAIYNLFIMGTFSTIAQ